LKSVTALAIPGTQAQNVSFVAPGRHLPVFSTTVVEVVGLLELFVVVLEVGALLAEGLVDAPHALRVSAIPIVPAVMAVRGSRPWLLPAHHERRRRQLRICMGSSEFSRECPPDLWVLCRSPDGERRSVWPAGQRDNVPVRKSG
jgi:hypothetical protein